MKKIFVLRHSKSSWKDSSLGDFHRPLNSRGKTDAPMMSSYLSTRIDMIDFLHCSSAIRTSDTSKYFIERINFINIEYDESLYHSSSLEIINNIKYYDEQYNSAMIIAHNPGLTNFVNEITNIMLDNLPTTGLVEINFDCAKWADISQNNSTVIDIKFPKQLK